MPMSDYNDSTEAKQSIHVTPEMCYHCFDILIYHWFHPTNELISSSSSPPMEFISSIPTSIAIPLFVTWEIKDTTSNNNNNHHNHHHYPSYRLRGCIGTFQCQTTLSMALGEYAKLAAFKDQRFDPISRLELHSLRVSVSLLVNMESCIDCYDWDIGIHGIQIRLVPKSTMTKTTTTTTMTMTNNNKDDDNRETTIFSATYLPDVAKQQGWTKEETIRSLLYKAGYRGPIDDQLLARIQCKRYQSSKHTVTFQDYAMAKFGSMEDIPLELRQLDDMHTNRPRWCLPL